MVLCSGIGSGNCLGVLGRSGAAFVGAEVVGDAWNDDDDDEGAGEGVAANSLAS